MFFRDWRDDQTGVQESEVLAEGFEFGVATTNFKVLERKSQLSPRLDFPHPPREIDKELPNVPSS